MDAQQRHRQFLNRFYGANRHFYDWSRKYYLFGRDGAQRRLLADPWQTLVEVGAGTGRNLAMLREKRPDARFGAVDASDVMLTHLRSRHPWVQAELGFAESVDLVSVLGAPPDRVLFSYALSMILDPFAAIANARRQIAPEGKVVVVDFADFEGLGWVGAPFRWGLHQAHVHPVAVGALRERGGRIEVGPLGYWVYAEFGALAPGPEVAGRAEGGVAG